MKRDLKAAVEAAFRPLRCVAEISDDGRKLAFRVFDPDGKPVLIVPEESNPRDDAALATILDNARGRVRACGFALEPWKLE